MIWKLLLALFCFWVLYAWLIKRKYASWRKAEQIIFAKTSDGVSIALHRYFPKDEKKRKHPVILCHGLGANRFNLDFDDRYSLAAYLAQRGFDCYVAELRGVGWSKIPAHFPGGEWNYKFEDFIRKDVPTAIEKIMSIAGVKEVHWVGHSMGGLVLYGYSIEQKGQYLRSATLIGSPANFGYLSHLTGLARSGKRFLRFFPGIHQRFFTFFLLPIVGRWNDFLGKRIYLAENCDIDVIRFAAVNLVTDQSSKLLAQFSRWILEKDFSSDDGISWQNKLAEIKHPVHLISGAKDYFAKPDGIEWIFNQLGSQDKTLREFGKKYGDASDYGHGDLVVGRSAPGEVFPAIAEWIEKRD